MAEYAKLYKKLWTNSKFMTLSDDAKLLWIYIISSPHSSCSGVYRLSKGYIMGDLKWEAKRLAKAFDSLLAKEMIKYDPDVEVILIPSWFEHNVIVSKTQLTKAEMELEELPQTILAQEFNAIIEALPETKGLAKGLALPNSKGLAKSVALPLASPLGSTSGSPLGKGLSSSSSSSSPSSATSSSSVNNNTPKPPKGDSAAANKVETIPYALIINDLNQKAGTNYKPTTDKTRDLIRSLWNQGFRAEDFFKVHDIKIAEWINNPEMCKYIRPVTLYSTKFEGYLNQIPPNYKYSEITARNIEAAREWINEMEGETENDER
jgi:uncharacterized phage protein (TIGR02220 family)